MEKTYTTKLQDFNELVTKMAKKSTDALQFQLTEERHFLSKFKNRGDLQKIPFQKQKVSAIEQIIENRS